MKIYRLWSFRLRRAINLCWRFYNLIKLNTYGINHGKHTVIHGHFGLYLAENAFVRIGDFFYCSSGKHLNPLCRNIQANITINKNAILCIGNNVGMSSPTIWAHISITIGNNVMLGANVTIMDSDAHSLNYKERRILTLDKSKKHDKPIVIEDDVFIGMNSIILKGVTIGARSIIGAGSVVTESIPADCIVAGNPAKIIRTLNHA